MTRLDPDLSRLAPAPVSQQASDALRDAIVSGRLRPGRRLKEIELADMLGVSRGPVREALRQLAHEGLVASLPYRATEVLGISQEEIVEVLVPIRLTIETFAFRKALSRLSEEDLGALQALVRTMREAAAAGDLDQMAEADVRFHELVIERSGQPHCLQIWRSIEPRVRAYFRRDAPAHTPPEELAGEHDQLLEALRRGDEQHLVEVVRAHIGYYFAPDDLPPTELGDAA